MSTFSFFTDTALEKRKKILQDFFHFTCTCRACIENFPIYDKLEKDFENADYAALTTEAQSCFDSQDYRKGMDIMIKRLTLISDNLKEPHQLYIKDRAAFLECLWQCYGNRTFLVNENVK